MILIIGVAVYFLIVLLVLFFAFRGCSSFNKEVDKLKGQITSLEREVQASKNGQSPVAYELTILKDELARKKEELAEQVREKTALEMELSQMKSQQVDEALRAAEMAVKDKEIRRLKSELAFSSGSGQETEKLKESL